MSDFVLADFLPYQLNVLAGRLSRQFAARYRAEAGISVAEWRVLAHLSQTGSVSVREIVARVDMDKSKVSRAASRLEAAGHVTKASDAADGRLVALALTPQGRALFERLIPVARAYETEVMRQLGAAAGPFRAGLRMLLEQGRD